MKQLITTNNKENVRRDNNNDNCKLLSDKAGSGKSGKNHNSTDDKSTTIMTVLSRSHKNITKEISKQVLKAKLNKLRHLVLKSVISPHYLENDICPRLLELFDPQTVTYNGGIANVKKWRISCYLEVMEGGVPCTNPNLKLLEVFRPLLETCDNLFLVWYKQQHACNDKNKQQKGRRSCMRLMTFVTRYTPAPGEQALLKHIDGAGKVDGSCVVALPSPRGNSFEGYGGGLTFWDGKESVIHDKEEEKKGKVELKDEQATNIATFTKNKDNQNGNSAVESKKETMTTKRNRFRPREIHYDTRAGDLAFIDRAVWHQANPITRGTRWALVIFYKNIYDDKDDNNNQCQQRG